MVAVVKATSNTTAPRCTSGKSARMPVTRSPRNMAGGVSASPRGSAEALELGALPRRHQARAREQVLGGGEPVEDALERDLAGLLLQLRERAVCDQAPLVDDDDPLAHPLDHVEQVRAVDDRLALARERRDQGLEGERGVGVEAVERLVAEAGLPVVEGPGGDADPPPQSLPLRGPQPAA